jgi:hypothetical protein
MVPVTTMVIIAAGIIIVVIPMSQTEFIKTEMIIPEIRRFLSQVRTFSHKALNDFALKYKREYSITEAKDANTRKGRLLTDIREF